MTTATRTMHNDSQSKQTLHAITATHRCSSSFNDSTTNTTHYHKWFNCKHTHGQQHYKQTRIIYRCRRHNAVRIECDVPNERCEEQHSVYLIFKISMKIVLFWLFFRGGLFVSFCFWVGSWNLMPFNCEYCQIRIKSNGHTACTCVRVCVCAQEQHNSVLYSEIYFIHLHFNNVIHFVLSYLWVVHQLYGICGNCLGHLFVHLSLNAFSFDYFVHLLRFSCDETFEYF